MLGRVGVKCGGVGECDLHLGNLLWVLHQSGGSTKISVYFQCSHLSVQRPVVLAPRVLLTHLTECIGKI